MTDLRDLIANALDTKPKPVDMTDEWGCVVFIKRWSWEEKRRIQQACNSWVEDQDKWEDVRQRSTVKGFKPSKDEIKMVEGVWDQKPLIALLSLCDENGKRLFTEDQLPILMARSPESIEKIVDAAFQHNSLGEAAGKDCGPTPAPGLPSDWPLNVVKA